MLTGRATPVPTCRPALDRPRERAVPVRRTPVATAVAPPMAVVRAAVPRPRQASLLLPPVD